MAMHRSLKIPMPKRADTTNVRTSLTSTTHPLPSPPRAFCLLPSLHNPSSSLSRQYFFSPIKKWVTPFQGPPLLFCPPWKLLRFSRPPCPLGKSAGWQKEANRLNATKNRIGSAASDTILQKVGALESSKEGFSEKFVNLPNMISFGRLVSGPFIGWMITNELYSYAVLGLAISGATDWLDGYVARRLKIDSVVGSYLDPLADKVLIGSVALAMVHVGLLHPGLVAVVLLRDVGLVAGAVYHRASKLGHKCSWYDFLDLDAVCPEKVEPLFISKVNTVLQLALVTLALLQPDFGSSETQYQITYLSWLVATTTVASTAVYGAQFFKNRSIILSSRK